MIKQIITWDLGGTKCAAGIIHFDTDNNTLICVHSCIVPISITNSLRDLISQIEMNLQMKMHEADAICIGAAGHYDGEILIHENVYPYAMDFKIIAEDQKWPAFTIIHDYASVVCATFTSYMQDPDNIKYLNSQSMVNHGRRVALGIGTGLGLKDGVLLKNGDFWLGENEFGHIGITTPPYTEKYYLERHREIICFLHDKMVVKQQEPIIFEKILSGKGTVRLFQFFYPDATDITPELVGAKMRAGEANEMQAAFAWYIGLLVGTVQLAFMPEGGIWITGGVSVKNLELFDHPEFYRGIEATPSFRQLRDAYPMGVLCNQSHALMGSGYYAARRLLQTNVFHEVPLAF